MGNCDLYGTSGIMSTADGIITVVETGQQTRQTILELYECAQAHIIELRNKQQPVKILIDTCSIDSRHPDVEDAGQLLLRLDCDVMAVCGTATMTRLIANFFLRRYRQSHRVRYFRSHKTARKWLEEFSTYERSIVQVPDES